MEYTKPHLTYEEQVDKLIERGLGVPDRTAATALLQSVGYYRLSAYVYPFRVPLPEDERTAGHSRSEKLLEGVTLDHVRKVWEFDRKLRLLVLDATEVIEVGLRTHIAYVLGRRDRFGHVAEESLDKKRCAKTAEVNGQPQRAFDMWCSRYNDLRRQASREDFVIHNTKKYSSSPLAIWVAVEFLDFGAALRLYNLLQDSDRNEIARTMGFKSGATLASVLLCCSNTRNKAAHHGRLWNRPPVSKPPKIHDADQLLAGWPSVDRDYMYAPLLLMAYLVRHIDPTSRWPVHAREQLRKFPDVPHLTLKANMGFPEGWEELEIWKRVP